MIDDGFWFAMKMQAAKYRWPQYKRPNQRKLRKKMRRSR